MTETVVDCRQVTKEYGKNKALDGFSVSIPSGHVVGVLGPNGCGKSSLFRLITGLIKQDKGKVSVLGQAANWQTNKQIAYLPDRARWYPNHTALNAFEWGNTFLPGFNLETAKQLAAFMDIELDMKIGGMSRGQEARILLILCIARDVSLIVLDEPFTGIDVISRETIVSGMIDFLEQRKQSILISTHDIGEVEGLFDYTVMMDRGKAIWSGETDELRAQYGSLHNVFRFMYKKEWKP